MSITRRLFLRNTAAVGASVTVGAVPATAEPVRALTPDQRIAAAIEEIKIAYWEKWPDAPLHIDDFDNIDSGMLLVLTHCSTNGKPGTALYAQRGRRYGGDGKETHTDKEGAPV